MQWFFLIFSNHGMSRTMINLFLLLVDYLLYKEDEYINMPGISCIGIPPIIFYLYGDLIILENNILLNVISLCLQKHNHTYIERWRARTYQGRPTSQRDSWVINSTLPENNYVEYLFYYTISPSTISPLHHCTIAGFQWNSFPQKLFSTKGFSTKCRKITMRTKQVSLGYSLFLGGVLNGKSYLIYQRTSWQTIQMFK